MILIAINIQKIIFDVLGLKKNILTFVERANLLYL